MSSLHDPFDLIETGQDMDNVVPFLAPNKVNQMIETALAKPQLAPRRNSVTAWKFTGMGLAACLALLMVFGSTQQEQIDQMVAGEPVAMIVHEQEKLQPASAEDSDEAPEVSELVMLETLEPY